MSNNSHKRINQWAQFPHTTVKKIIEAYGEMSMCAIWLSNKITKVQVLHYLIAFHNYEHLNNQIQNFKYWSNVKVKYHVTIMNFACVINRPLIFPINFCHFFITIQIWPFKFPFNFLTRVRQEVQFYMSDPTSAFRICEPIFFCSFSNTNHLIFPLYP